MNDGEFVNRLFLAAFGPGEPPEEGQQQPKLSVLYSARVPANPAAASTHLEAGVAYRGKGDYFAAFSHFRAAVAHTVPEITALVPNATLQPQIGEYPAA